MKYTLALCYFFFSVSTLLAQLSNFENNEVNTMRFALYYGIVDNAWSQKVDDIQLSNVLIDYSRARSNFSSFRLQSSHRYKILGDIVSLIYTKNGLEETTPGTPILTNLVGWHNFTWSIVSQKYMQIAIGGHLGDYFYGIEGEYTKRINENNTTGSTYYHVAAGPALIADLALGASGLFLHYEGAFGKRIIGETPLAPDQLPDFMNHTFDLRYKKMFFNFERVYGLNKTGNRSVRSQFGIGVAI